MIVLEFSVTKSSSEERALTNKVFISSEYYVILDHPDYITLSNFVYMVEPLDTTKKKDIELSMVQRRVLEISLGQKIRGKVYFPSVTNIVVGTSLKFHVDRFVKTKSTNTINVDEFSSTIKEHWNRQVFTVNQLMGFYFHGKTFLLKVLSVNDVCSNGARGLLSSSSDIFFVFNRNSIAFE